MSGDRPSADMTIAYVLEHWPQTARVFNEHNMACVGCAVAPFYCVAEAAAVYNISLEAFLAELQQVSELTQPADDA